MSIIPYLDFYFVKNNENEYTKFIDIPFMLKNKELPKDVTLSYAEYLIAIKNIGNGIAINPEICEIYYNNKKHDILKQRRIMLSVGDVAILTLNIVMSDNPKINIKMKYSNLLGDEYEQNIEINSMLSLNNDNGSNYDLKYIKINDPKIKKLNNHN